MHPDQPSQQLPQPEPEYGLDYLNQISAPPPRARLPNPIVLFSIIGVGLLAIVGFALLIFNTGPNDVDKAAALNIRLKTLQQLASSAQPNLRDNSLRSTNAAFSLYLSNTLRDINAPITAMGAGSESAAKSINTTEVPYTEEIKTEFEEAKLNVMFDRTYAREMAYQIGVLRNMMSGVYKTTTSVSLKQALETSDASFEQSLKSFESFAGS